MSFPDDTDPFENLKSGAVPPPRDAARQQALHAARVAFEAENKKAAEATQGNALGRRLISIITSLKGISIMDMRLPVGTAAIALLVLPLGWQLYSSTALTPADRAATQLAQPLEQAPADADMTLADAIAPAPEPMMLEESEIGRVAMPSIAAPMASKSTAPAGGMALDSAANFAPPSQVTQPSGDAFASFAEQRLKLAAEEPVSTFSLDVDTASYAYTRRMLEDGYLPERDAVRIEELINYFPYDYPAATSAEVPFQPTLSLYPTPWNANTQILQIGIKGFEPEAAATKSNLVFLIDTSGSMDEADKLPLLKRAFGLLLDQLSGDDTVSIVTYAGSAGVALPPTSADRKASIMAALDQLYAGGSTAGAEGIELAYRLAGEARIAGGTNRVILATDGDFNVGINDPEALKTLIADKRQDGISLSVLGFGRGNLDDATMQALAQNGNGNASYISNFAEAKKVLVEEIGGTLHTIAKDVKIQVEFNPALVSEYRLIGYETRALNREDFNNDAVDAGDVGAGTSVTALYEITPVGSGAELVDPLRYGQAATPTGGDEIAFLKMRYKLPDSDVSQLIETPVTADLAYGDIADAGVDVQFAAAVAAFGQKLKGSAYGTAMDWDGVEALAQAGRGVDEGGYRAEFIRLVDMARLLKPDTHTDVCDASASGDECE
ncbi:von Willebrand factor type A domain-containing protein [Devosia sp. XJ19-1]|uniref:von Willebrand factor type A domain-containing protein n=1 Tax=Devosia ureilytica TaxID=2952754 RepID=A0A9Q4APY6_9HYPH|nr:von Willebrand factor type A domain-containing protein [Devosia ureilytica]MCP8884578.1 von Willebrand factor type A domain-containing protein [Devosia ureilytica]MCP8888208.1 von Willebrand factor type A domain-containing protein [Devosia ureilytica]